MVDHSLERGQAFLDSQKSTQGDSKTVDSIFARLTDENGATAILDRFGVVFADSLPETFTPPDEIVQGLLTAGGCSVFYGSSNSGKTFLAIDIAAAVARGVPWMGKQTEQGLVVYLATESPASVRSRLQAYQRLHRVRVPNLAIVQSPVDLFAAEADTDDLIELVREIERQRGQKAHLIIGDTLARLSAGANENAGQDMGVVIARIDRIRAEASAHFLLIHHSGKDAAKGSRGWSGVLAAVDTEVEVTDSATGHCAEITKQRDLATKGERIGFRLAVVQMGSTKWGSPATSCIVEPETAPQKATGKRPSAVHGAVLEVLRTRGAAMRKSDLAKHFEDQYTRSAVYREMRKMIDTGILAESSGTVEFIGLKDGAN